MIAIFIIAGGVVLYTLGYARGRRAEQDAIYRRTNPGILAVIARKFWIGK